ncbi:MAG TPA: type VI secretion system baseplate subunit TssF [Phycisphaerae bacterium]|nr:type VI secretion system baseplate subunit TssF [Phycisphaerae bacterium]HUU22574.1 type VI secretion system baseplate subunit TssF [Phycisphaerae bacterium]
MDRRLLNYYNRELQHIKEMGAEFAREFPKIAGRLGMEGIEVSDPYVERLIEGFAFLAARVHLKLEAEFPRFTQSMLDTIYPHYLTPTPSMAVVRFFPDLSEGALAEGFVVPRATELRSSLGKGEQTACEYRTAHDVTLLPIQIVEAEYYTRELASLEVPKYLDARAGIRIRLECTAGLTFGEVNLEKLVLFLGGDRTSARLYEQVFGHTMAVLAQSTTRPVRWQKSLPASAVRRVGFSNAEALLPYDARSFHGYRLLHEYFVFPERFMFFEINGLKDTVAGSEDTVMDVILLLDEPDLELQGMVDPSRFVPFCTPAINLFPKRADMIHLAERFSEHHVVPDRTRPRDFEVYTVLGVRGYGTRADEEVEFQSFYSATDIEAGSSGGGAYYTVHRLPRMPSSRERRFGRRSSYAGSEVFLSLVDAQAAPFRSDLRQLGVDTLCTNRDLPLQMAVGRGKTDFTMDVSAPVEGEIRCIAGPTPPKPSHVEGEVVWRAVSHLALNYLSLVDQDEHEGASALRDLLRLYGDTSDPAIRKQIEGVKQISYRPITRRVAVAGPISFARGLEVTVALDEEAFEGGSAFLMGAVLERFFAKYVSINSFTETVVRTADRGQIMRWQPKVGQRHIL